MRLHDKLKTLNLHHYNAHGHQTCQEDVISLMSLHHYLFYDGGCCHVETSPLICSANQRTGFYMITASVMKELSTLNHLVFRGHVTNWIRYISFFSRLIMITKLGRVLTSGRSFRTQTLKLPLTSSFNLLSKQLD